jgi:cold-inducible RNA-binding protein
MKLYVGNMSKEVTETQFGELMAPFGTAGTPSIAKDKASGASRGFGFIEFNNDDEARAAIAGLDGKEVNGKALKVNESRSGKDVTPAPRNV